MDRDYFWLSMNQFGRLEPRLPTDTRGKQQVEDSRVVSEIVRVLKSVDRWVDAPAAFSPRKSFNDCFVRWAAKGVWPEPRVR